MLGIGFRFAGNQKRGFAGYTNPHRYWRMRCQSGYAFPAIKELQWRGYASGPDLTGSGTASASGVYQTNTPDKAFDNSTSTLFAAAQNSQKDYWIAYDFGVGVQVEVNEVVLTENNDPVGVNQAPIDFAVEYSDDGTTWTPSWMVIRQTWAGSGETRTFTKPSHISATYWGVYFYDTTATNGDFTVPEVEFRGSVGGANFANSNIATNCGTFYNSDPTYNSAKLFDGDAGTRWATNKYAYPTWAYAQFSTVQAAAQAAIKCGAFNAATAKTGRFLSSLDGYVWLVRGVFNNLSWTASETKTFTLT